MSRSLLPPLTDLTSALPRDAAAPTEKEIADLKTGMLDLLVEDKALPVVATNGQARDPNWGKDIDNIMDRVTPHFIHEFDEVSGLWVTKTVAVAAATIQAEVDAYGHVCAWIYEEA